jgi:RHS repeat-associated protein
MIAPDRTTWYFEPSVHQGSHYERTRYASAVVEHRHTLYGGGYPIGEVITFDGGAPSQTHYFHDDQQGSVMTVTDSSGAVIAKYRYDPWGKQTIVTGAATGVNATRQGHTGHEMLEIGLTHMNGRLYDPVLARFTAADPLVQAPYDLQSLNRYSYVFNNPLGYTDPSGYEGCLSCPVTVTNPRWQSGQGSTSPAYSYSSSWNSSGSHAPYSPGDFEARNNNSGPAVQSGLPVLPPVNVIGKHLPGLGEVADFVVDVVPSGYPVNLYNSLVGRTLFEEQELDTWERVLGAVPVIGGILRRTGNALDVAKSLGANPFKGKTSKEVSEMLEKKGYVPKGPDPTTGRGTYVNPKTDRGYHIDASHPEPKGPHVGIHRPREMRDILQPRDYPMENP